VYRRVVGFPGDFSRGITPSSFPRSGASNEARAIQFVNCRRLRGAWLWLIVALVTFIAGGTASAAAAGGSETRVRANSTVVETSVGQHSGERPASVGCLRPSNAAMVVGSCVATNTGPPFENRYPEDVPEYTQRIAAETALSRSNTYIYVVQDGLLKIGDRRAGHIDLADGRPVEAAGEFRTKGGKVVSFNNASGHYCPSGPEAETSARVAFARYGMSIEGPYTEVGS
jgi:hypothetical protein